MKEMSKAQKQRWINFWNSDTGKKALAILDDYLQQMVTDTYLCPDYMQSPTDTEKTIIKRAYMANGANELLSLIRTTSKRKKQSEP